MEKLRSLLENTPLSEEVSANCDIDNERIQDSNYQVDLSIRKVKSIK